MRAGLVAEALGAQRAATLGVLLALLPPEWDAPGYAGRTPREVAAHLLAVDTMLSRLQVGWLTRVPPEPGPLIGMNPAASARWRDQPPESLLAALEHHGRRLARLVTYLPPPLSRWPVRGLEGSRPFLGVVVWRVLDEWIRHRDLATDAARSSVPGPGDPIDAPRGEVLAGAVLASLPARVLPRVPREIGVARLQIECVGPVGADDAPRGPRRVWGLDFARRHYGPRVTGAADVVVRLTAPALALVAAGRVRWRDLASEALRISGDEVFATDLLDALAPVSTEQPR